MYEKISSLEEDMDTIMKFKRNFNQPDQIVIMIIELSDKKNDLIKHMNYNRIK